jgi:hypothetical protein
MLRAVLAPIAGYAVIGVLVIFTDQLFSLLTHGFDSGATPPHSYFLLSLVTDSLYTALGGYFCAAIARSAARRATLILILGGELIGVGAVIALWHTQPHWFAIGLLLIYPPAVWAGSRFRMRGEPSEASV